MSSSEGAAVAKSQQGLYRVKNDQSANGAISLKLRDYSDTSCEALVSLCQAVYNDDTFMRQWIVGFSYEFSPYAIKYLPPTCQDELDEFGLTSSYDELDTRNKPADVDLKIKLRGDYFKNSKHDAIILPYATDIDTFLSQREHFRKLLEDVKKLAKVDVFEAFGVNRQDMKILGSRFVHGARNAEDCTSLERHVLTERGSTFLFTQVFDFDQSAMEKLTDEEMESIIGRTVRHQQFVGNTDNTVSHIERMRTVTKTTGLNVQVLRLAITLLTDPQELTKPQEMKSEGEAGKILTTCNTTDPKQGELLGGSPKLGIMERGLYFVGCCRSPACIKTLLDLMLGTAVESNVPNPGHKRIPMANGFPWSERLLTFMTVAAGGYFWIPSAEMLSLSHEKTSNDIPLQPIWDIERRNNYMFFNMQQWTYYMTKGEYFEPENIPSSRILHLCSVMFDRWGARWTKEIKHVRLPHLEDVLVNNQSIRPEDFVDINGNKPDLDGAKKRVWKYNRYIFAEPPMGDFIKDIPVVMRKGLAIREQLRLFTDTTDIKYHDNIDPNDIRAQLDTLRLEPGDLLAGTLEEFSLASGKIAMEYLDYKDERDRAKAATLSELSAMGHIVPDYGILLQKGLETMRKELKDKIAVADKKNKKHKDERVHFWKGANYALEGIQIYLENYANLAERLWKQIEDGSYVGPDTMPKMQCTRGREPFPASLVNLKLIMKNEMAHIKTIDAFQQMWTTIKEKPEVINLKGLESRLRWLKTAKPDTFFDAVQLFFAAHACLHQTADPVSAGRLDQLFKPFYDRDLKYYRDHFKEEPADKVNTIVDQSAQDIIDALCLKWSEKINFNMTRVPDATSFGTTAVMFGTGPFCSGDSNNQWFHQVSLGGLKENSSVQGEDGCNEVTMLFLKSMRRLPLTAPCISLRVNDQTKKEILEEAAKAILSGGAQPVIFHDRNISTGLKNELSKAYTRPENKSPHYSPERLIAMSRQFACDGCYEPLMCGYSDFSFLYVDLLLSLECALNRGATYKDAGPEFLRGQVINWSSPPVEQIQTFDELLDITIDFHLDQMLKDFFSIPLAKFGALADFCPSPLLSCLMHNAVERGRDLTRGGAMVHIVTPMLVGLSNFIDSLFAIKTMVYDTTLRLTTLSELALALISNWGRRDESWKPLVPLARRKQMSIRYDNLRQFALSLPKFGGHDYFDGPKHQQWLHHRTRAAIPISKREQLRKDLNEFGQNITRRIIDKANDVAATLYCQKNMKSLQHKYSDDEFPFQFTVCIGSGTFENYVGIAQSYGASADGRLAGQPIASDCSPAPSPIDLPPLPLSTATYIQDALRAYDDEHDSFRTGFSNGCEIDINLEENTTVESLTGFLRSYGSDTIKGTSIMTFTTGDPDRYEAAIHLPQQYELFRVRMGGWSNYYISQWPVHQQQHSRRPFYKIFLLMIDDQLGEADVEVDEARTEALPRRKGKRTVQNKSAPTACKVPKLTR